MTGSSSVLRYSGHSAKSAFAGVSLTFPKQGSLSPCWNQTALKWRPLAIASPHSISAQCHFLSSPLTTLFKIAPPPLPTLFFCLALIAMSLCHIPSFVLSCFVLVYLLSGILVRLKAGGRQGFCWFCSYCAGPPFLPAPLEVHSLSFSALLWPREADLWVLHLPCSLNNHTLAGCGQCSIRERAEGKWRGRWGVSSPAPSVL